MQAFACRVRVPIPIVTLSSATRHGLFTLCRVWQNQHHGEQCCLAGCTIYCRLAFYILHYYLTRVSNNFRVWQNLHHDRHAERC